jgi:hypothetical protein
MGATPRDLAHRKDRIRDGYGRQHDIRRYVFFDALVRYDGHGGVHWGRGMVHSLQTKPDSHGLSEYANWCEQKQRKNSSSVIRSYPSKQT